MEMSGDNPKTKLTAVKPSRKGIVLVTVLSVALILLGCCGGVIYWLFEHQATWSNCASTFDFRYSKNGQEEVNVSKMLRVLQKIGFDPHDLDLYYSSFSAQNFTGPRNGTATPTGYSDTPTHGCTKPPCSTETSRRQLGALEAIATIGKEIGQVWDLVKATSDVSTGNWVGAVPQSMVTNWASLKSWTSYTAKPMGLGSPACNSSWGQTYVDWSVTWEGNGQYIENAKILASAHAAWGMHVTVTAQSSKTPLNIGTTYTVAQISFELTFSSQGGWASTYTESVVLYIDATGYYSLGPKNGNFC